MSQVRSALCGSGEVFGEYRDVADRARCAHGRGLALIKLMYQGDGERRRILRTVYECGVFQELREKLRCKEIWVAGAEKWRNPDLDLPADFEDRRAENYAQLREVGDD